MRRRTFLSLGVAGAATLAAAGWWASLTKRSPNARALDDDATRVVAAIVPAMLDGALPGGGLARAAAIRETVDGVALAIASLPPAMRVELERLFMLLALPAGRRVFAGVAAPWREASPEEVARCLDAWRASAWLLKRTAYDALRQLIIAAWYGNPRSWSAIGYPGPPVLG
jgi:hypothetical protein